VLRDDNNNNNNNNNNNDCRQAIWADKLCQYGGLVDYRVSRFILQLKQHVS
jgi:hypothetical protein